MTADTIGGVWTFALELARALGRKGVEVVLATMGARLTPEQWAEARPIAGLDVRESTFQLEWMADPWQDLERAGEWLLALEEEVGPDLIHLNSYVHGALPWGHPRLVVGHSCVLSWWQAVHGEEAPPAWERYRQEVRRGLQAAEVVAAPSRAMRDALESYYGPLPAVRVIPNGRDPLQFSPGSKEPLVLSVGRLWDQAKNVAALARAAPGLPWPVFVAGEDRHPEGGTARPGAVHSLGRLAPSELAPWFGRAAIYALPARYEPFGLSVLEAGLAGCALVLGDIPSLRENWDDAALFVPPQDSEQLQARLRTLMIREDLRVDYAARARVRAGKFTSERMGEAYLAIYREMLQEVVCPG
ncbi:MAG: glycosyltransferase family 4 protein [Planctomycetes bacterium]|nr:glycosyltransferase family 4 protein [Planctomycetota bacterium]